MHPFFLCTDDTFRKSKAKITLVTFKTQTVGYLRTYVVILIGNYKMIYLESKFLYTHQYKIIS